MRKNGNEEINMKYDSVFDVLGQIMVGPSSSHTAGACKIGFIANQIFGEIPQMVNIYLHGSFAETYRGHKTDVAIVGGLLGFTPEDERIPFSFDKAKEKEMEFQIKLKDLGTSIHPNSVLLELRSEDTKGLLKELTLIGSSIGGGNIIIKEIDNMEAGFDGNSPTIIEIHKDKPGILSKIIGIISSYGLNINQMRLSRNIRKGKALSWIEVSSIINDELKEKLLGIPEIEIVRCLNV
jgi:L-serine dehydratase